MNKYIFILLFFIPFILQAEDSVNNFLYHFAIQIETEGRYLCWIGEDEENEELKVYEGSYYFDYESESGICLILIRNPQAKPSQVTVRVWEWMDDGSNVYQACAMEISKKKDLQLFLQHPGKPTPS